jgi:hypothetical protein
VLWAAWKLLQNCHIAIWKIIQTEQRASASLELKRRGRQHIGWVEHNYFVKIGLFARGARVELPLLSHSHEVAVVAVGAAAPVRLLFARAPKQPVV